MVCCISCRQTTARVFLGHRRKMELRHAGAAALHDSLWLRLAALCYTTVPRSLCSPARKARSPGRHTSCACQPGIIQLSKIQPSHPPGRSRGKPGAQAEQAQTQNYYSKCLEESQEKCRAEFRTECLGRKMSS